MTKATDPKVPVKDASKASFTIGLDTLSTLLENKANTVQICTYLTLARSMRKGKTTSSTGLSAITNRVHIGKERAERILTELAAMGNDDSKLISKLPDKYTKAVGYLQDMHNKAPLRFKEGEYESAIISLDRFKKIKPSTPRWKLAHSGGLVWFPDSLVGSKKDKLNINFKKLKLNKNDVATRLLLLMYICNDLELNAVWAADICAENNLEYIKDHGAYRIYKGITDNKVRFSNKIVKYALPVNYEDDPEKPLQQALQDLEHLGFVHRVLMIATLVPTTRCAKSFYEIDYKDSTGRKSQNTRLDLRIRRAVGKIRGITTRGDNRSYNDYYLIAPANEEIVFITLYRLKFQVDNPKNLPVSFATAHRALKDQEILRWIDEFEGTLTPESLTER